jgi:hypothetical protein
MSIADVSIRPNSIRFRDAVRSVHERLRAEAGEFDCSDESGEARALRSLFEGSQSAQREELYSITRSLVASGLLGGSLRAHFSDASEARDIPGWAWADFQLRHEAWMFGSLVLPALLPDEWQRWSGEAVFLDCKHFDGWLAKQDFSEPAHAKVPEPFDAGEKPELIRYYPPPARPYVTLSEALSWIAFGTSFVNERLIRAIDELAFGPERETSRRLEDAVSQLTSLALSKAIEIRGKYLECDSMDDSEVRTHVIDPIAFHDFAQFDIYREALRYGAGLAWKESGSIGELLASKRSDSIRSVAVERSGLLRSFPLRDTAPDSKANLVENGPIGWSDFDAERIPDLERLHELALRDEWWTWPEAIAWVGSRDARNIATLRHWAIWWASRGNDDPTITLSAQAQIASRFCTSAEQTKRDLANAIERGVVQTAGRARKDAKSEPLESGDWRGGTVVYADGTAQLVSAANRMSTWAFDIAVSRSELVAAFPPTDVASEPTSANVPANRKLDHDMIRQRAIAMKHEQPRLSKGSAAASIIAELGQNPRTGKPWDNRHIERIIGPLWEGGHQ